MSGECWKSPTDQRLRLPTCSHVIRAAELPSDSIGAGYSGVSCPVCDTPQLATRHQVCSIRDGVPASSTEWGRAKCHKRKDLTDARRGKGTVVGVGSLLARMSSPAHTRIGLPKEGLTTGPWLQDLGPAGKVVLRAAPAGCTVENGTITLPTSTVMLLGGRGARFQHIAFQGGVIVCSGADHCTTFTDCSFHGCHVYAVHGAAVTLRRCTHRMCHPAVIASGTGTTLHLAACTFRDCINAVAVEHGATAEAADCTLLSNCAVIVRGRASQISLVDCHLEGTTNGVMVDVGTAVLRQCVLKKFVRPFSAFSGGVAEVHACVVHAALTLAVICGRMHLLFRECALNLRLPRPDSPEQARQNSFTSAMLLRGGDGRGGAGRGGDGRGSDGAGKSPGESPRVQIDRCHLQCVAEAAQGVVLANGAAVAMVHTRVDSWSSGCALFVKDRKCAPRAMLAHCAVRAPVGVGCIASGPGSTVRIVGGSVMAALGACEGSDHAVMTVRGAELTGNLATQVPFEEDMEAAATAHSSAVTRLYSCSIRQASFAVVAFGGTALVTNTRITDDGVNAGGRTLNSGQFRTAFRNAGGHLSVVGGLVRGYQRGASMVLLRDGDPVKENQELGGREPGSSVFEGVKFDDNALGLAGCDGTTVRAVGCEFHVQESLSCSVDGAVNAAGVLIEQAKNAVVQQCSFTGLDVDMMCDSVPHVEVRGCSFAGLRERVGARLKITGTSDASIEDCTFVNANQCLHLQSGCMYRLACSVTRCEFKDYRHGVFAHGDLQLTAQACQFKRGTTGVSAFEGAKAVLRECDMHGVINGLEVSTRASVEVRQSALHADNCGIRVCGTIPGGDDSEDGQANEAWVHASGCSLQGDSFAVEAHCGADVELQQCTIDKSITGVHAMSGSNVRVASSEISAQMCGVEVGASVQQAQHCRQHLEADSQDEGPPDGGGAAECFEHGEVTPVAKVALEGLQLRGCLTGLLVKAAGEVIAKRVHASDCRAGFCVGQNGHNCSFEGCSVSEAGAAAEAWPSIRPGEEVLQLEEEGAMRSAALQCNR